MRMPALLGMGLGNSGLAGKKLVIKLAILAGIHLEKSPRVGKSTSEDILGGRAYSGQYSILKGCNSQGGAQSFQGGANAPPPPLPPFLKETLPGMQAYSYFFLLCSFEATRLFLQERRPPPGPPTQ